MKQQFKEQDRLKRLHLGNVITPLPNLDEWNDRKHFAPIWAKSNAHTRLAAVPCLS
jgi:hypothetical protein